MPAEKEIRISLEKVEFRANDDDTEKNGLGKLTGYAAVFNERVNIAEMFDEVIVPGAFKRAIKEGQDVRALIDHEPHTIFARSSAGTLRLKEDKHGLYCEMDLPDTTVARDLRTNIDAGNITQMSFGFRVKEFNWIEPQKEGDFALREIRDVDLKDVSAVTFPAYEGTSIEARSAETVIQEHKKELEKGQYDSDWFEIQRKKLELAEVEI